MPHSRRQVATRAKKWFPSEQLEKTLGTKGVIALEAMVKGETFREASIPLKCDYHRAKTITEKMYRRLVGLIVEEWMGKYDELPGSVSNK